MSGKRGGDGENTPDGKRTGEVGTVSSPTVASTTSTGSVKPVTAAKAGVTGGPTGSGDASQSTAESDYDLGVIGKSYVTGRGSSQTFKKTHLMYSYGFSYQLIKGTGTAALKTYVTSPLMYVPWDRIWFYMTKTDFSGLPPNTIATHCSVSVKPYRVRTAFETGSSQSILATLNQNVFLCWADDLEDTGGMNYSYGNITAAEPMKPTTMKSMTDAACDILIGNMYGQNNITMTQVPTSQFTLPTIAPFYYCFHTRNDVEVGGFQYQGDRIHKKDAVECFGETLVNRSYNFAFAPLSIRSEGRINLPILGCNKNVFGPEYLMVREKGWNSAGNIQVIQNNADAAFKMQPDNDVPTYYRRMERSPYCSPKQGTETHKKTQPSLHVGVEPVPRFSPIAGTLTKDPIKSYTDVQILWEIQATLHTKSYWKPEYYHSAYVNMDNQIFSSYNRKEPNSEYNSKINKEYCNYTEKTS